MSRFLSVFITLCAFAIYVQAAVDDDGILYHTVSEYVEDYNSQKVQKAEQVQAPRAQASTNMGATTYFEPSPFSSTTACAAAMSEPTATATTTTIAAATVSASAASQIDYTDLFDLESEMVSVRDTFNGWIAAISVIGVIAVAALGAAIAALVREDSSSSSTAAAAPDGYAYVLDGDACVPCGNPCGGTSCKSRCTKKCGGACGGTRRTRCKGGGKKKKEDEDDNDEGKIVRQTLCNPHLKGDITTVETYRTFHADGSLRLGAKAARAITNVTEHPQDRGCYIVELAHGEKVPKVWCREKTLRILRVKDFCNCPPDVNSECYEIVCCKECDDFVIVRAAPRQKPKVCDSAVGFAVQCAEDLDRSGLVLYGKKNISTCDDKVFVFDAWKNAWTSNIPLFLPSPIPLLVSLIKSCEKCLNIVAEKIGIWAKDKVDIESCDGDICLSAPKGKIVVETPCLDLCAVTTAIKIPFDRLIPCNGGGGFVELCHLAGIRFITWQNCPAQDLKMVSDEGWTATVTKDIAVTAGGNTNWTSANVTVCATDANGGIVFKGTTVDLCNFVTEVLVSKMRNCLGKPLEICAVGGEDIVVSTDGGDLNLCGVAGNIVVPFDRLVPCTAGPADLCALDGLIFKIWQNCTGFDLQMTSSAGWTADIAEDVVVTAGGDTTWTSENITFCATDASGGIVFKGSTVDLCNFVTEVLISKVRNCGANPLQICAVNGQDIAISTDGGDLNLCGVTGNVFMPFDRLLPCVGAVADFCHLDGLTYKVWNNCPGENLSMISDEGWTANTNGVVTLLNGGTNFTVQNETSTGSSNVTVLSRSTVADAIGNFTVDATAAGQALGTLRTQSNALQRSQWTIQSTNGNVTTQIQMRADVADTPTRNIDFTSDDIDMCTNVTGTVRVRNLQICSGGSVLPEVNNNVDLGSSLLRFATIYGNVDYVPANVADWSGIPPTSVQNALDRIAAFVGPIP